jgi:hypothetical protein
MSVFKQFYENNKLVTVILTTSVNGPGNKTRSSQPGSERREKHISGTSRSGHWSMDLIAPQREREGDTTRATEKLR